MSFDPDENLLDESLREAFRDYHLPPADHMHVWDGVEKRIATLAAPRHFLLSYRLLLPLTAALGVGVAVGWLLPHPAAIPLPPQEVPAAPHSLTTAATLLPAAGVALAAVATALPEAPAATGSLQQPHPRASPTLRQVAAPAPPAATPAPVAAAAALQADKLAPEDSEAIDVAVAAVIPTVDTAVIQAASTAPAPAVASAKTPAALPASTAEEQEESAAKTDKQNRVNERMLYHKPSHRQSERGAGRFRRWLSRLTQGVRHIF